MERILKCFKDLFKCENPVKRHLMYVLLMVLPCLSASFLGYIDKETPKETIVVMLAFAAFFFFLSIVPLLYILGFGMEFYELRLKGETGVPKVTSDSFTKGVKSLPLCFAWGFYYGFLMLLCVGLPIFAAVTTSIAVKDSPMSIVGIVLFTILLITVLFVGLIVVSPFMNYVWVKFVKDYQYKAEYFNPFILIKFIRKSFKETMMVMLKMIVASFVLNSAASMISLVVIIFMMAIVFSVALFIPEQAGQDPAYHPLTIMVIIPFSMLSMMIQSYATNMTGFAAADLYVEVYKNKIEPTENELEI